MANWSTLIICAVFVALGVWMIVEGQWFGWVGVVFFGGGGLFLFLQGQKDQRGRRGMKEQRLQEIAELRSRVIASGVTVPDEAVAVWKSILLEEGADWVVFANGTLVVCEDDDDGPQAFAQTVLAMFEQTVPGTYTADYSVYPHEDVGVWVVTYPGNHVFNYVSIVECASETAAGMLSRVTREQDANEKKIVYTHVVDRAQEIQSS